LAEFFGNYPKRFGNLREAKIVVKSLMMSGKKRNRKAPAETRYGYKALNDAASRLGGDARNLDESVNLFILDKLS
jgi:hypothetical protein